MGSHSRQNLVSALAFLVAVTAVVGLPTTSPVHASSPNQYGPATALVVSQSCPSGIAVDTAGTVYWVNRCSGQLLELLRGASFPSVILTGLNGPYGVGVDAAGNVYFDEYYRGTLSRLKPGSSNPQILLTGLNYPNYMSVDSAGDIYFITGQTCGDKIERFDASSHSLTTLLTAPQPHDPNHGFGGLFIDQSGNLYYATCDYLTLNLLPSGSSSPSTILNTMSRPTGVAVDRLGDVFYALYNSSIDELVAGSNTPTVLTTQGSSRLQLTLDPSGNLYYTDDVGGRIWELPLQSSMNQNVTVTATGTATITSTLLTTSILSSTIVITSISPSTQTVSISIPPTTTTLTSLAPLTQTITEKSASSNQPTMQTFTASIVETLTIKQTSTETSLLVQSANARQWSSITVIGLVIISILIAYIVFSSRRRSVPASSQQPVDQTAIETIDGIVIKYVSDHGGKISISAACSDLGITEPQLRESLKRLMDKGSLSK